ncbi:MAG TPA: PAS domain-containing protein [Nannocystis sp.]
MGEQTLSIEAENAVLKAEVARLQSELEAERREKAAMKERLDLLEKIVDKGPYYIYIIDHNVGKNVFMNRDLAETLGYTREEIDAFPEGKLLETIVHPDDWKRFPEMMVGVFSTPDGAVFVNEYRMRTRSGEYRWYVDRGVVFSRNPDGTPWQVLGTMYDITEAKRQEEALRESKQKAEDERLEMQAKVIAMQEATIRELESPLLPIAEGVLVMPLVGEINEARAEQIIQNLLSGISRNRATVVILDITGVRSVDERVAGALLQAARATRLLGARFVLTGASPDIATTLVAIGADLSGIVTLGTLQSGIAWAIQQR